MSAVYPKLLFTYSSSGLPCAKNSTPCVDEPTSLVELSVNLASALSNTTSTVPNLLDILELVSTAYSATSPI